MSLWQYHQVHHPHRDMSVLSMLSRTHLSSDGIVGHDIKQLVKNLKPRQVAARQHKSG